MSYQQIIRRLKEAGDPNKAVLLQRFFKTGKGQYGEGDRFIGVMVPQQRAIAKMYANLDLTSIGRLLASPIHEYRLTALIILVAQFKKGDSDTQRRIYTFYLSKTAYINNWDLVDLSARDIVGGYLVTHKKLRTILYRLARSSYLWNRRIAIVATFAFIKDRDFADTLALSEMLLNDRHDLMHKAVGWALREVGKQNRDVLTDFLQKHAVHMPRTALRYSLEHYPRKEKDLFMAMRSLP